MFGRKFTLYLEKRDEEARQRDEEARQRDEEARQRDEEARRRDAEFKEEAKRRDAESKELSAESREFHREILLRNEKVYTTVIAEMEEGRRQIRADTQAVLSALDRFNGSSS